MEATAPTAKDIGDAADRLYWMILAAPMDGATRDRLANSLAILTGEAVQSMPRAPAPRSTKPASGVFASATE